MISVIVPSNRIGGLDVLFDSLEQQSTSDFELILVDAIYRYRREVVADMAKRYTFRITHIPPRDDPFPRVAYCQQMNTGVAHAQFPYVLYLCDYVYLSKNTINRHIAYQQRVPSPLLADFAYTPLPELKASFAPYVHEVGPEICQSRHTSSLNENTARYHADLESGKLRDLMWSIFKESPRSERDVWNMGVTHTHYKNANEGEFTDYNYCCFKNESFPTEMVVSMNGHDEDYDQSHAWQDSEFSYRLRHMGIKWHCLARYEGEVRCLNPRSVLNIKHMPEPFGYNKTLCDVTKRADLQKPVNPGFSLKEWRSECLSTPS